MKLRRRGTAIVETDKGILLTAISGKSYILPGGGASRRESRMQAAIRELKEETNLEPYFAMALFRYKARFNYHTVYFIKAKGTPRRGKEVRYIAYYKKGTKLRISQSSKEIIKKYLKFKKEHKEKFEGIEKLYK